MSYSYTKKVNMNFDAATRRIKEELQKEDFVVLTEIDVKATLKKKLDINYEDYIILGACNPAFAHKALLTEKEIGLMMPCNVIVYRDNGKTFVSTILPTAAMGMIDNEELPAVAADVEKRLKHVIDSI